MNAIYQIFWSSVITVIFSLPLKYICINAVN